MSYKDLYIDGKKIPLCEVAVNGNKKLYKFSTDWRIQGAPFSEVAKSFPDYQPSPYEILAFDYLIEEDGELQLYEPDGTPFNEEDIESSD